MDGSPKAITRHDIAKVLCRLTGVATLLLLLFWNPLFLRPRFWTAPAIAFSVSIDAALIIAGVGLVCLKKWGALVISAVALLLLTRTAAQGAGFPWSLILLLPALFSAVCWRVLSWGNSRRDFLFALASIVTSGLLSYVAFVMRHA